MAYAEAEGYEEPAAELSDKKFIALSKFNGTYLIHV